MGDFDPAKMLSKLSGAGVDFLLIGGMAAVLHGDAGVTFDLDIVPAHDAENLKRLAVALRALEARIRAQDAPSRLAFGRMRSFSAIYRRTRSSTSLRRSEISTSRSGQAARRATKI